MVAMVSIAIALEINSVLRIHKGQEVLQCCLVPLGTEGPPSILTLSLAHCLEVSEAQ